MSARADLFPFCIARWKRGFASVPCDAVENWTTRDDFKDLLTSWVIDATPFHPASLVEVR